MTWFKSIFTGTKDSISSKRVCGVTGWLLILACHGYCCIDKREMPDMGELIVACVTLLGVDSVTSIFKERKIEDESE